MSIRRYIAILSLVALASCSELITTEPPEPKSENSSYGWTAAAGASLLRSSDGSGHRITVGNGFMTDSSASGIDTLVFDRHVDSVLVSGLNSHSFLPLPFGSYLEADTSYTTTNYPADALMPDSDSAFFASANNFMLYDPQKSAMTLRATLPAPIQFLERSGNLFYAVSRDGHLFMSVNHGFRWVDKGLVPGGPARAAEASPYGTIYVATGTDIQRFDGQDWKPVVSPGHPINCLKYFSAGPSGWTIFAGTDDGYVMTIQSTGQIHSDQMIAGGSVVPITAIGFDFGGGPSSDKIWAAGRGAIFEGRNFGQSWLPMKGAAFNVTVLTVNHDDLVVGTTDGKIVTFHDDNAPQQQTISANGITALSSFNGEFEAIAGGVLYTSGKQRDWTAADLTVRVPHAIVRPWVFLTKDTLWRAGDMRVSGMRYTFMGRVLDHAPKMNLHGREHKDILVVRYAVESGKPDAPDLDSTNVPMYVIYFELRRGPVRIEIIQQGKPSILEEVE